MPDQGVIDLIKNAKIGRERKDAQVETCAVFAAALHDVLQDLGLSPSLVTVGHKVSDPRQCWYHEVVDVDGVLYDSLGEFSEAIMRKRLKVKDGHSYPMTFEPERREGSFDVEDYGVLYEFLVEELAKSAKRLGLTTETRRPAIASL